MGSVEALWYKKDTKIFPEQFFFGFSRFVAFQLTLILVAAILCGAYTNQCVDFGSFHLGCLFFFVFFFGRPWFLFLFFSFFLVLNSIH